MYKQWAAPKIQLLNIVSFNLSVVIVWCDDVIGILLLYGKLTSATELHRIYSLWMLMLTYVCARSISFVCTSFFSLLVMYRVSWCVRKQSYHTIYIYSNTHSHTHTHNHNNNNTYCCICSARQFTHSNITFRCSPPKIRFISQKHVEYNALIIDQSHVYPLSVFLF